MSPVCQNCGSTVSARYVRVFVPEHRTRPECCPACPDMIRDNGLPRRKLS